MPRKERPIRLTNVGGMSTESRQTLQSLCLQALNEASLELVAAKSKLDVARVRLLIAEAKAPQAVAEEPQSD